MHLYDPHSPYEPHIDSPPELASALAQLRDVPTRADYSFLTSPMPPEQARKLELLYRADVFYADQQIGRLLDFFAEAGLKEDALTVITADLAEDPTGVSDLAARDPRETADLERILERWWQEHVSDTEPSPQRVDEDLREQLRSLGYVH